MEFVKGIGLIAREHIAIQCTACFIAMKTYPPETQLWSFCLCRGHYILVNFSETSHVTVISLDVLYRAHSGLHRDTKCLITPSHRSLKMAKLNLVKNCTSLWKYYIL